MCPDHPAFSDPGPGAAELRLELERLQARVRRLAEEKSNLQLVLRLIEQINPTIGLEDMIGAMLHNIVETVGGTNIRLWFWIEQTLHYADFFGMRCTVAQIDDALAEVVAREHRFVQVQGGQEDSLMRGDVVPGSWTWVFPLMVGAECIGVIKLENIHVAATSLSRHLPLFFSHAALILSNEIRNHARRQALAALEVKTRELDSYFNTAIDLFCIVDHKGVFLKLNPAWQATLGYALEEMLGHCFEEFVHPDDLAKSRETIAIQLANRDIIGFVNRYRHKDGSWRWIEWRSRPRDGLFYAAARDITERRQAEDALRLAASVFANSQEGIVVTDPDNRIIDVNEAFCRITGYRREEVIGKNPNVLQSGRHEPAFYQEMWRNLHEHGRWRGEIWNRRKSGEVYAEILSIDAVRDASGEVLHYVGAFSDISPLKAHQAELERIAHYDPLTGLPNRRLLADRLQQNLARSQRNRLQLAVCYLDLDGFKEVNDRLGHEAGDQLLVEISRRLQHVLRKGDTVARLGGDEFVLLFCDLPQQTECLHALERVLAVVASPIQLQHGSAQVSASIGATLYPADDADADTLLRHADQAMYQAKEAGKGRFCLYQPRSLPPALRPVGR